MSGPQPPYALFVIATDIDVNVSSVPTCLLLRSRLTRILLPQYANDCLTRAWKGNYEAAWELYLATDDYNDAPKKRDDNELSEGTRAPVAADFAFPFVGKTLEECAQWLQRTPEDVELNRQYFAALTQHSREDDTVLLCRIVNPDDSGNNNNIIALQYFPVPTGDAVIEMQTALGMAFDERLQNYQRQRMQDGKPDRSKGEPYAGR